MKLDELRKSVFTLLYELESDELKRTTRFNELTETVARLAAEKAELLDKVKELNAVIEKLKVSKRVLHG